MRATPARGTRASSSVRVSGSRWSSTPQLDVHVPQPQPGPALRRLRQEHHVHSGCLGAHPVGQGPGQPGQQQVSRLDGEGPVQVGRVESGGGGEQGVGAPHERADLVAQLQGARGGHHPLAGPNQQGVAHRPAEFAQHAAGGGGRGAEPFGGARHAALPEEDVEGAQQVQVHGDSGR
ncbi:hypothetical protein GCM10020254_77150 [Streptomyces goshikiensis]